MTAASTRRRPFLRNRALVAMGVVSLLAGGLGMRGQVGFLTRFQSVEAEVVAVENLGATEGFALYRPTLRFSPSAGEILQRPAAETYRPTRAGERLTAGFDPENVDDIRLMDVRDRWLTPAWMLLFAVVTFGIAAYRWRNPPEPGA